VAGRLLGPGAKPLDGVCVKVQFRSPRGNFPGSPEQVEFVENPDIKTDADGSFKTPKALERKTGEVRVEVAAPGFLPGRSSLGQSSPSVISVLATIDPARVLDMIENRVIANPAGALIQVALGQCEDDPAAAIATIQADNDPGSRAAAWLGLEAVRPALDRALRQAPVWRDQPRAGRGRCRRGIPVPAR
jgi:hypothetical protein